ncbi:general substrate transporter [Coniophora puteana RWD-64-598 SS2]|uniref:General substrate transporter n=1 Tax=Coniophora puteana (strain RWD-64-598) TaxID=741705 RepID=A0A5M3MXK8_CONPW|nr:general substrate transporter [Coniophora puteana RWD-64-598 SS2]EIW83361.1 general substrate transporter [Coniophora puteana RWD-64-598 SS2]
MSKVLKTDGSHSPSEKSTEDVEHVDSNKLSAQSPAQEDWSGLDLAEMEGQIGVRGLFENKLILGISCFATLGGFLFGYDQGVVSNILAIESFGAAFPSVYMNASLKGWYVSAMLLCAWFGSLVNGPICDKIGRKRDISLMVVIFELGIALQTGATSTGYLFGGRAVGGFAVGALTHVVPMYLAEISSANIRGSLVALQQQCITLGIVFSYWIAYGTSFIGGVRCAPGVPFTGPLLNGQPTFNPYTDVPSDGCTGQTQASWRVPVGFQMFPALCLGIGMLVMPYSPRWLVEQGREEEALETLSWLRRKPVDDIAIRFEFLEIKAEVRYSREYMSRTYPNVGPIRRSLNSYLMLLSSWPKFKRLAVGCLCMFYQQFIGQNSLIYYAPTIFGQLGLDPTTTSLLATGIYGIVNSVFTIPAVLFLDSLGRKPLLMSGALGCCSSLIIVGSLVATYSSDWPAHTVAGHVAIAFVYIYNAHFSYSWAPIGWVLPSEIFPLHLRSTGISITTSTSWMMSLCENIKFRPNRKLNPFFSIIGLASPTMLTNIPSGGTYFFFAGFALLAFLTSWLFFPETKGRTLEEMDKTFGDNSTEQEREHMDRICRELGLPEKALLSHA